MGREFRVSTNRHGTQQSIDYLDHVADCQQYGHPTVKVWRPFIQVRVSVPLARLRLVAELLTEHWTGPIDGAVQPAARKAGRSTALAFTERERMDSRTVITPILECEVCRVPVFHLIGGKCANCRDRAELNEHIAELTAAHAAQVKTIAALNVEVEVLRREARVRSHPPVDPTRR